MDQKRSTLRNPYICGGWVAGPRFYGRGRLVQEIIEGQSGALYILGGRRSGKTSLLRRVEAVCAETEVPCLFLDLQATGRTIDGLFRVLRAELRSKARYWGALFHPDLFAMPDLFALIGGLQEQAEVQGSRILLLLDEAEVLLEIAGAYSEPLASLWETMRGSPALRIVMAASRALMSIDQLLEFPGPRPFWEDVQLRCLVRLDEAAAEALIRQRNSSVPVQVTPQLVGQVQRATGCQPYLLQLVCQRLYQPDHSLRPLTKLDLEVNGLLDSLFRADYQQLLAEERTVLWCIVDRPGEDMAALQAATGLEDECLATCLTWLECLGYVRRQGAESSSGQGTQRFYVTNEFLASWLLGHREMLEELEAGIQPTAWKGMVCHVACF